MVYQATLSYRAAILALIVFFILGGVLLSRVKMREGIIQLGQKASNDAGQCITTTAFCHAGITGRVEKDFAIWGADGSMSTLQNQNDAEFDSEVPCTSKSFKA